MLAVGTCIVHMIFTVISVTLWCSSSSHRRDFAYFYYYRNLFIRKKIPTDDSEKKTYQSDFIIIVKVLGFQIFLKL